MKTNSITSCFALLLLSFTFAAAGPFDPDTVPESAETYFHVNFDKLAQGEIADIMTELDFLVLFETGEETPLKYFTNTDGDVTGSITAYLEADGKPNQSVIRATGLNDKEGVLAEIRSLDNYKSSKLGEYTIHSWIYEVNDPKFKGGNERVYGTFVDEDSIVASQDLDSLEAALIFLESDDESIDSFTKADPAILAKVDLESMKAKSNIIKWAKGMELQMDVARDGSLNGTVDLETSDRDSAQKIHQMIEGMVAFGSVYEDENGWNPADNIKAKKTGSTVSIDLTVPVSFLKKVRAMK